MSYPTITDKLGDFKDSMDKGTIYYEFNDGSNFAIHESLLDYTIDGKYVYREFLASLISNEYDRKISKIYYKSYNKNDNGDTNYVWVDLNHIYSLGFTNSATIKAYNFRHTLEVDVKNIKAVTYIDENLLHNKIDEFDGNIFYDEEVSILNFRTKNRDHIKIEVTDIHNQGMIGNEHLKNDLKITSLTDNTFEDCLFWLNGLFVDFVIVSEDKKTAIIKNGKSYLDTRVIDFSSGDHDPKANTRFATLDIDPSKNIFRYDFDLKIFKWDDVLVSKPTFGFLTDYDNYLYEEGGDVFPINYSARIYFNKELTNTNHILLCNGVVVKKEDYDIVNNSVILKRSLGILKNSLVSHTDNGYTKKALANLVEKSVPNGGDYQIVYVEAKYEDDKVEVRRSNKCFVNFPYSYHVTFPNINFGDIVLIDGCYEKYLVSSKNSIRYPFMKYMPRYTDRSAISDCYIERLYVTKSNV